MSARVEGETPMTLADWAAAEAAELAYASERPTLTIHDDPYGEREPVADDEEAF